MAKKYVQANTLYLAGSGTIIGATSIVLTNLTDIYGNVLTMTDFGDTGYITLEPDTSNEEAATFTGVTANANGTYTLTGVKTALAKSPYTETAGLIRQHSGGTKVVITDSAAFWNTFANKSNDETIAGKYTFTTASRPTMTSDADTATVTDLVTFGQLSRQAISGAANASTTVKGIVELATQAEVDARTTTGSTGALLVPTPDTQRSTLISDYTPDVGATATITIASPAVITLVGHSLVGSEKVIFTTTGALPTGITSGTTYYVLAAGITTDTFRISLTDGGAAINTSGIQSGVHTCYRSTVWVINPTPAVTSITNRTFSFRPVIGNTSNTNNYIIISGLPKKFVGKGDGTASLAVGDIASGTNVTIQENGGQFAMTTPSALALNSNGDGSQLTGIGTKIIRLAGSTQPIDTVENTIYTTTISAGLLSTTGMIRMTIPFYFNTDSSTLNNTNTFRLKFGGSTVQTVTIDTTAGSAITPNSYAGTITAIISNNASLSSQNVGLYPYVSWAYNAGSHSYNVKNNLAADTTSAINTGSSQTLAITVQRSTAGSFSVWIFQQAIIEVIKGQ